MKYRQLTKEQFSEMHHEFAQFLATQQIDAKEWETMKKEKPTLAEEELNLFSDVVWEKVLKNTSFLEHVSAHHINLFKCDLKEISRIYVQLNDKNRSFLKEKDYQWFLKHMLDDDIEYFKASKKYSKERNTEIFELVEMGSQISNGELFNIISELIR
jgi:hypothetical protein